MYRKKVVEIKAFKIARIQKGIKQGELSQMLGMSVSTLNRIENGHKPIDNMKVKDLRKICNMLGLDIADILKENK